MLCLGPWLGDRRSGFVTSISKPFHYWVFLILVQDCAWAVSTGNIKTRRTAGSGRKNMKLSISFYYRSVKCIGCCSVNLYNRVGKNKDTLIKKLKLYCINVLYGMLCICCEMWWKCVEIGFQVRWRGICVRHFNKTTFDLSLNARDGPNHKTICFFRQCFR